MTMPSQILYKAADLINERGWWQGDWTGPNGEVCADQAVREVEDGTACSNSAWLALHLRCKGLTNGRRGVMGFNDDPSTTKEDVLLALKQAAYELESEGR